MPIKDVEGGRVYIPENDKERKTLEGLIEKELVEYVHGAYWLSKKGVEVCKEMMK